MQGETFASSVKQSREYAPLRTFTKEEQPPLVTIDHTHYGQFPTNRLPHRDFTQEKRHYPDQQNRPSKPIEQVVRPRVDPVFSSPEDRPRGKLSLLETDVYAPAKLAAARAVHGCRHYPEHGVSGFGASSDFAPGGKHMLSKAQVRSSAETPFESTLGRITRLSEDELNSRNQRGRNDPIEYTSGFYMAGACVPAPIDMSKSRSSGFGYAGQGLKDRRISEQLWAQQRRSNQEVDARKRRTYQEVEAERHLHYEQRLVCELPDEYVPPVAEYITPPVEAPPPETAKERRAREKKAKEQGKTATQQQLATH